jgi:hypothetical protein
MLGTYTLEQYIAAAYDPNSQMSRGAQLAQIDFTRLAAEQAGSLYFDDFLRHGGTT